MNIGVTIIICTYNGIDRLGKTIEHVANQDVPAHMDWEVIIADNGSVDNSADFSENEWTKYSKRTVGFNVIKESKPGKLHALQKAIKNAKYEYIVICDDDNWLSPNYVSIVFSKLNQHPEIAAVGGLGIPETNGIDLPDWFDNYGYAYAVGPQSSGSGKLKRGKILWGAGLATRRTLYTRMYESQPSLLLESSKNILSAEDSEYCLRLLLKGHQLYYDDSLIYKHFIPAHKLDRQFRRQKLQKGFEDSRFILRKYYAAMKAYIDAKNRPDIWVYLFIISCLRYALLFANKDKRTKAKDTLFHLLPCWTNSDPISTRIKAFMNN
ncbi:MAG TPA: glycosyltransferase [Pedobacter sp.]|nr:glycosyltransferase [Pedobacter sp.]